MLASWRGQVYAPYCGSGGMFVQSEKFIDTYVELLRGKPCAI
jgi:type I restriction-modification system DNA methylase subunit